MAQNVRSGEVVFLKMCIPHGCYVGNTTQKIPTAREIFHSHGIPDWSLENMLKDFDLYYYNTPISLDQQVLNEHKLYFKGRE